MSKKGWIIVGGIFGGIGLVIVLLFASITGTYNRLVGLNEQVDGSWAQVETVLQRRYDLIPNLVNTVQGFADQEREVLTEVTRLRSQWGEARTQGEQAAVAGQLEGAIGHLMLVSEQYPELRSNQNFLALQDELAGTENRSRTPPFQRIGSGLQHAGSTISRRIHRQHDRLHPARILRSRRRRGSGSNGRILKRRSVKCRRVHRRPVQCRPAPCAPDL